MLHIIFNSEYKNDDQLFVKGLLKLVRENCIEVPNPTQFIRLISSLRNEDEVIIWVHIGTLLASNQALSGMVVEFAKEAEEFLEEKRIEYKKITRSSEIASKSPEIVFTHDMIDISKIHRKYFGRELKEILNLESNITNYQNAITQEVNDISASSKYPKYDYAVITALYESEFEELGRIFDFPEEERIETNKKVFHKGYLKKDRRIEIIAAVPNATGMLDSSILATMMLEYFKPKYLFMSGVCGGSEKTDFGDIILAKQIYTFQKGKLSDLSFNDKEGNPTELKLYDKENNEVDLFNLHDKNGVYYTINLEKFEIEHDTMIPLDFLFEDRLNPKIEIIKNELNQIIKKDHFFKNKTIDIKIEAIACSNIVVNKKGFFENTIKPIHRKTAAVEMESYGVARACQYANNGKTIPIIFKSVMDKTFDKEDAINGFNIKKFAAFTSAQFLGLLFKHKVI
jgi:nucleoside phosphorylase